MYIVSLGAILNKLNKSHRVQENEHISNRMARNKMYKTGSLVVTGAMLARKFNVYVVVCVCVCVLTVGGDHHIKLCMR